MEETPTLKPPRKSKPKQPSSRLIKYIKGREKGLTKKAAKTAAGYSPMTLASTIEESDTYKRLSVGSAIESIIPLTEIAQAHAHNIRQDKDLAARNAAIKMAYERIEPDNEAPEQVERVIVILKEPPQNTL